VNVDGKKISHEVIEALAAQREALPARLRLGVLMGEEDAASASFVKIKERIADKLRVVVVREGLKPNATTAEALRALVRLTTRSEALIVQLPLPKSIDIDEVLAMIPAEKDADAVNPTALPRLVQAPVAGAIAEIFMRHGVAAAGKKAIVVGAGRLVGAPAAALLHDTGARVSVITETRGSLAELKDADIVILGAGEPNLVKPAMLKEGVVLIDAGTSEDAGRLAGDADPECAQVASLFTPVPGGVGPVAVAMLFKNLFILAKKAGLPAGRQAL
jgi:methylenetetrahydrofolate dehydrogenase (NADP+)/methenyltetrahydrofolate cyclohydrolase